MNLYILFCSNGLAIWHGLPDIRYIKVKYGQLAAISNFIELKFLRAYPLYLKPHILFHGNG